MDTRPCCSGTPPLQPLACVVQTPLRKWHFMKRPFGVQPGPQIGGNFRTDRSNKSGDHSQQIISTWLLATQLPTDIDLGSNPQTPLCFRLLHSQSHMETQKPSFSKINCPPSGLDIVLDQLWGMKIGDPVGIQLISQLQPTGSDPAVGIFITCLKMVRLLLFLMHIQSLPQQQTRRMHTAIPSAKLFCPFGNTVVTSPLTIANKQPICVFGSVLQRSYVNNAFIV